MNVRKLNDGRPPGSMWQAKRLKSANMRNSKPDAAKLINVFIKSKEDE